MRSSLLENAEQTSAMIQKSDLKVTIQNELYLVKKTESLEKVVKHRFLSFPCHSCTPMIPNTKKIRKDKRRTLPSIGSVSRRSVTRIRIPAKKDENNFTTSIKYRA